jgi:hypothetical protein
MRWSAKFIKPIDPNQATNPPPERPILLPTRPNDRPDLAQDGIANGFVELTEMSIDSGLNSFGQQCRLCRSFEPTEATLDQLETLLQFVAVSRSIWCWGCEC